MLTLEHDHENSQSKNSDFSDSNLSRELKGHLSPLISYILKGSTSFVLAPGGGNWYSRKPTYSVQYWRLIKIQSKHQKVSTAASLITSELGLLFLC